MKADPQGESARGALSRRPVVTTERVTMNGSKTSKTTKASTLRLACFVVGGLVLGLFPAVAGCQGAEGERGRGVARPRGEAFRADNEPRAVHRFAHAQGAAGARHDATLHPDHFDRGTLNSLGQEKLELMLKDDDACDPLVVYVDVPSGELMAGRMESVKVYLKDRGLEDRQIQLEAGANPAARGPAAPGIAAKRLIDSGAPIGTNPEPTGSAGAKIGK